MGDGSDYELYVVAAAESQTLGSALLRADVEAAKWLPGRDAIVVLIERDNGDEAFVLDVATGGLTSVGELSTEFGFISVSPDGVLLAASSGGEIGVLNLDTGARSEFNPPDGSIVGAVQWSPDGQHLAFETGRSITIVDRDLANPMIADLEIRNDDQWRWSNDGTFVELVDNSKPCEGAGWAYSPEREFIACVVSDGSMDSIIITSADDASANLVVVSAAKPSGTNTWLVLDWRA